MSEPLSEETVRTLLLTPNDTSNQLEPMLMGACSVELILQLDKITMLPAQNQRLVAASALLEQVKQDNEKTGN